MSETSDIVRTWGGLTLRVQLSEAGYVVFRYKCPNLGFYHILPENLSYCSKNCKNCVMSTTFFQLYFFSSPKFPKQCVIACDKVTPLFLNKNYENNESIIESYPPIFEQK